MLDVIRKEWHLAMLRGLAALTFGVLTLVWPGLTLWVLVVMFGAFVLVDGVFTLIDVFQNHAAAQPHRGWRIFDGIISILAGVVTFVWPAITALALLFLIAAWAIISGVVRLWLAIRLRGEIPHAWLFGLGAAVSIAFGILLAITPGTGALVITWLIGWFAVVFAAIFFTYGWRLRGIERQLRGGGTTHSARPVIA
jgi:uncharacterized membrane protein HdeD (DUF308 family)